MTPDGAPVAVHPERTDDPAELRWYLGRSLVEDADVRRPLHRLVEDGVLADHRVGDVDVTTRLAPGRDWATEAPVVRAAVQETVRRGARFLRDASPRDRDAAVARTARDVLAAVVSPVATLHGGTVELLEVADGTVTVRLRGACQGCPAASSTLHDLLERELRRRLPETDVTVTTGS